jgi:hypothetical protein
LGAIPRLSSLARADEWVQLLLLAENWILAPCVHDIEILSAQTALRLLGDITRQENADGFGNYRYSRNAYNARAGRDEF